MKKKNTIIVVVIILIITTILKIYKYHEDEMNQKKGETSYIKIALFRTGDFDKTYYFILTNNATLLYKITVRKNDNISKFTLNELKCEKKDIKIKMKEVDFKYIVELAENLKKDPPGEKRFAWDSWNVSLLYKNEFYEADYWLNESDTLKKIVNEIIKLSEINLNIM